MNTLVKAALPQGSIHGVRISGVERFAGIPYGQAPVGALRFSRPSKALWEGDLDAVSARPIAPQNPSRLSNIMGDIVAAQDEDCLHLTVWTPASDDCRRPVLVWLHGGAWQSGGVLPWYDGTRLASEGDIVVVSVSYRLGALGWLPPVGTTKNIGLLDQELALDWVYNHIEAFGGDKESITVVGQSAGAGSICAMLGRTPIFSRCIVQSASLGRTWRTAAEADALASVFYSAVGAATLEQAREVPVSALLAAENHPDVIDLLKEQGRSGPLFGPVLDGDTLPANMAALRRAAFDRADVLLSYTRDELSPFPGHDLSQESAALGDEIFGRQSRRWAETATTLKRSAWLARFDIAPTDQFGACHCIELPFIFGNFDAFRAAPMIQGLERVEAEEIAKPIRDAWLSFIHGKAPDWPSAPYIKLIS